MATPHGPPATEVMRLLLVVRAGPRRAAHAGRGLTLPPATFAIIRAAVAALALRTALPGRAGDFETEDFALRFSAANSRLSTYNDVAGQGGASAASLRSTCVNPAVLSWKPLRDAQGQPLRFALSEQYTNSRSNAANLRAPTESLNISAGDAEGGGAGVVEWRASLLKARAEQ